MTLSTSSPKAHILVVDDDARLRRLLERYLREQEYAVSTAQDTVQAKQVLSLFTPDVMVLDVMMPGQTGLEFANELTQQKSAFVPPILMLTAMDTSDDRIAGLESGVEDYLTKPFEPRELLLRLGNILKRRMVVKSISNYVQFGEFQFDLSTQKLTHQLDGQVMLTTAESSMMQILAQHLNQSQSRENLAQGAQEKDHLRHVDVQIGRLRKKLGDASLIQTVRGQGYKLTGKAV